MEIATNATQYEFSYTDNSHLFDYPVRVCVETVGDMYISLPRSKCFEFIEDRKFLPFEIAGIEVHCRYTDRKGV